MLIRMSNADIDHRVLDERRSRQGDAAGAKVRRDVERQRVAAGMKPGARDQRCGASAIRARSDAGKQKSGRRGQLVQLDLNTGRRQTSADVEHVSRQLAHRWGLYTLPLGCPPGPFAP